MSTAPLRTHIWRVFLAAFALACGESITGPLKPAPVTPPEPIGPTQTLARVQCSASVATKEVDCGSGFTGSVSPLLARNPVAGSVSDLIVGGQNLYIKLTSSNVTYTGDVFSFTATVQNLIGQSLGTTDGTTLDPAGVRVFFEQAPVATSGTGTPDFINPVGGGSLVDGYATFTASNQAYYQYSQVLAPNQTSSPKTWSIHVPASVTSFQFFVYVSAEVQYPNGYITVTPASSTLKSGGTQALTSVVHDVLGRTVSDAVSYGTSNSGVATVNASSGVVTAVADGAATITATSTTRTGLAAVTVSTAAGSTSIISASPTSVAAGGTSTITIQARNASGVNMTTGGDVVVLNRSPASGTLSAVTDNGNGTYAATFSSTVATAYTISGTINGATIGTSGTVTFTAGVASSITKTAGDAQSTTAGTAVATAPSVTIKDANGNGVSGVSVTFAVASGGGSVTGATTTTNASGVATVGSWTLGATVGANTLTATVASPSLSTTFSATGTVGAAANIAKTAGDAQTATVNTSVTTAPSVTITDANGNPRSGVSVTFAVASGGGSVTGATTTTNASGVATVGSWTLGTTAGANTLTASVASPALSTTFSATGTAGAAANIAKSAGDAQSATVNTNVGTAPSVTITDANGNPKSGVSVTFAVASGGGSVTGATATTNASGIATVGSWKLGTTAGANTLTASVASPVLSTTFSATGTAGLPASATKQSTDPQTAAVGTAVSAAPSVLIKDANNNPVSGVTVTFAVTGGGGSVTTATPTTNASGIATVGSWTLGSSTGTSNNTLSATASTGSATTTFTASATAGAPASITVNAGDAQTAAVGSTVTTAPSVLVKDAFNNPVSGVTVTFSVTGGNGSATTLTPTTNASGIATVGSWTLGAGGASCSASTTTSCSRNKLHAVATGGSAPALDFKGYVPPIVPTATYQAVGNSPLSIASGIGLLQNAYSINGSNVDPTTGVTLSVTTTSVTGSSSGTATIASTGSFTYLSSPTYVSVGTATENFSYVVSDGVAATSTTSTLAVNVPEHVLYVQPGYTGTSTGTAAQPYKDFSATASTGVQEVAVAGDTLLVATGTGTATGGTLKNTQVVYGQGASASRTFTTGSVSTYRNGATTITLLTGAGTAPSIGALTLGSGNALRGFTTTGTLSGTSFGTLTVSETSINTASQAVSLSTGTLSGGFTSTTSTASTNNNISMTSVASSGTFSFGSGSLAGATNAAWFMNGGTATITYSGSITNTSSLAVDFGAMTAGAITLSGNINTTASPGKGISIHNNTGGTFTFSGAQIGITMGTGTGVSLATNFGATITFSPSTAMQVATTTGTTFSATGGGTVNVTGSANTLAATSTGTALNVTNTTIGASGLTFRSINAAGGGTNGIFLSATGTNAGLTVTGNGGACSRSTTTCDGGTIAGTSGTDGTTSGIGIYLNSTKSPSFTNMRINGTHQNFGIFGSSVTNLALSKVLLDGTYGTSTDTTVSEAALGLSELSGSATVDDSYFAGGSLNNVRLSNLLAGTTLNRISFNRDTIGFTQLNAAANRGLNVRTGLGTTNVTVANTKIFGGYYSNAAFYTISGTMDLIFSNNTLTNTQSNEAMLSNLIVTQDGANATGTVTYAITSNSIAGGRYYGIYFTKSRGTFSATGTITGNTITAPAGTVGSTGITMYNSLLGTYKTLIDQNTISGYNGTWGIGVRWTNNPDNPSTKTGLLNATIRRNTLTAAASPISGGYIDGIHLDIAGEANTTPTSCFDLGNGTGNGNILTSSYNAASSGTPFSIGTAASPASPYMKVVGLSGTYTAGGPDGSTAANTVNTPLYNLWRFANGVSSAGTYLDFTTTTTSGSSAASLGGTSIACNLYP